MAVRSQKAQNPAQARCLCVFITNVVRHYHLIARRKYRSTTIEPNEAYLNSFEDEGLNATIQAEIKLAQISKVNKPIWTISCSVTLPKPSE